MVYNFSVVTAGLDLTSDIIYELAQHRNVGLVSRSAGVIGAPPNIAPKAHKELYRLYKEGKMEDAARIQALLGHADWGLKKMGSIGGIEVARSKYFDYGMSIVRGSLSALGFEKVAVGKLGEVDCFETFLLSMKYG
ncbi:hypothetical protein OBBRIDRAFT_832927 [Obba rivulosa]|uniref:Uncharacterized protein n=1 Tax=Obba rivulosa TaxID=1052685 RepID=A0A8E2DLX8_9APHY|nr:hypothetical protein OBBRIDRAFT_832927 [Obba rivulosa]